MRKTLLGTSALAGVAMLASSAAQAATYIIPAPPPGAVTYNAFGINDNNIIVGSFTDSAGIQHGYFGPPDGSKYKIFDVRGVTGTQPRAILNDKSITGLALASGFTFGEEFYRAPDGTITILKKKKLVFDGVAQGGNDSGFYVGDYLKNGVRVGFKGQAGNFVSGISLPITVTSTNPRQINNNDVVAGNYADSAGLVHGFTLHGKHFATFDYPDAAGVTAPEGINDAGLVSGLWQDSAGNRHGFSYDTTTGKFKLIDPGDGSTFQEAWGLNNKGIIAGDTSNGAAFLYCPLKAAKCPAGGAAAAVHPPHLRALNKPTNLP